MTSYDLFLIVATVALIFIACFLCAALYWAIHILRIWHRLSAEAERNVTHVVERMHEALHAVASLRAVADIGMQTLQTALSVYRTRTATSHKKKKSAEQDE